LMKKRVIIGVVFSLLLIFYGTFLLSKSRSFQFFGGITNRINTSQKVVALTFDDAPLLTSNEVLEVLKQKRVKATFYVIGQNIEKYPQEAKAIVDAGMEIGNHSYSHKRFLFKSLSFIESEVQKTNTLIRNIGYSGEITFRPPNGKKLFGLPWYLNQHNIKTITWDVEPDTYASNMPEGNEKVDFLVSYTLKHTKPGSIILLHPLCVTCTSDREALGRIIDGLQSQGYLFTTVSELLSYK
jgi:chitin deacetylase